MKPYFAVKLLFACLLAIYSPISACAVERSLNPAKPTPKQDIENIVRARLARGWASEMNTPSTGTWDNNRTFRCIELPTYPKPDQISQTQNPLSWYMAFAVGVALKSDRTSQLKQLEALVSAGLLQKTSTELLLNGVQVNAVRYGLTRAGWKASTTDSAPFCFMYGRTPQLLDINVSEPINGPGQTELAVYTATITIGIPGDELEEWARSTEVQAAFPEIKHAVEGDTTTQQLIKQDNGWVPALCLAHLSPQQAPNLRCDTPLRADMNAVITRSTSVNPAESLRLQKEQFLKEAEDSLLKELNRVPQNERNKIKLDALRQINNLKHLPAPTEEEIQSLIRKEFGWEGGTMDIVALKLYFDKEYRYKFRIVVSLQLPFNRVLDPQLFSSRQDLQLLFTQGRACAGDFGFDIQSRKSYGGHAGCSDIMGKNTLPFPRLSAGQGSPLLAPASLDEAVAQGLLRKAEYKEADAWVQASMNENQRQRKISPEKQHLAVPPRPSMVKAYIALKDFIYPPGLYGGDSATFFIPKGIPAPIGNPGHSAIYDFNTLQCRGTSCASE